MPETRRHAAIMFTDIVGYTRLMGSDEEKAVDILSRNRSIHQSCIEKFNGTLIKEIGDGILASFSLASEAVRCAIEIQKECKEQEIPLKIGIHEGEMIFSGSDVIGDGVNIASRLQEDAQEGCIHISGAVYGNIRNKADIQTKLVGERSYKNVGESIKVYKVICGEEEYLGKQSSPDNSEKNTGSKLLIYLISGGAIVIIVALLIWKFFPTKENVELDKSIAVLPFDYLSQEHEKQYLADGVMDAITSNLAKISELRVIAKTSVERYREHSMDVRDIGKEIDVSYIVEGSFLLAGDKVRLIIQLINTKDGSNLWSNEYDRDWSDIFKVQSEVSQTIAKEIAINITSETKEVIESIPTTDLTAYDYYLRGREYQLRSGLEEDLRIAIQMYEKAVNLDSNFVLAWIGLAGTSRQVYWFYYDRSEEQLIRINKYLDYAISLSPNLKEVQIEEGTYFLHCKSDYRKALNILEPLISRYPKDDFIYYRIGSVYRRMGDFNKSLENNLIAISINPSFWRHWYNIAYTYIILKEYNEAEECLKKAINLNPSLSFQHNKLLELYVITGRLNKAREYSQSIDGIINDPNISLTKAYIEVLDKNYETAIQIIESLAEDVIIDQYLYSTKHLQLGLIYRIMFNKEIALHHFVTEKVLLSKKVQILKNDQRPFCSLGIAYAGLGMKKEAIDAGEKALDILSFANDAIGGYWTEIDMVKILVMVSEYDDALDRLDKIISKNGSITVEVLKLDPFWNPVRDMDKFKEIISNPKYQIDISAN